MKPKHDNKARELLGEIRKIATSLPPREQRMISNRCDSISTIIKKLLKTTKDMATENYTQEQIAERYIAKKAIFEAMMNGRHISFLDSREFEVSEMHTQMCCIRQDIAEKKLPLELKDRWMTFGKHGKRCKEYWIEKLN